MSNSYEYVVVGSGAGGGTVAARLAEEGHTVLVLEAGGDPRELSGGNAVQPDVNRLPLDYDVPVFHAISTENDAMKWDFFVDHYSDPDRQKRDSKYSDDWAQVTEGGAREVVGEGPAKGVLYPRAGTLGGCTAHNAMITVYPHNRDWDEIWEITGDPTWKADNMRKYFQRLENCHHRLPPYRWLAKLGFNFTRHGWDGWLQTEKSFAKEALGDKALVKFIVGSAKEALEEVGQPDKRRRWLLQGQADPNDWRLVKENAVGLRYPPLTTRKHARHSTRERLLDVQKRFPDNLHIELDALATKVIFEGDKAVGVEYLKGKRLYSAFKNSQTESKTCHAKATREVILAGGAFNTPQLLKLSGIGPRAELENLGIPVKIDLPGVGENLQDRYEVGIVFRMKENWELLKGATFSEGDPLLKQWQKKASGPYAGNGAVLAVIKRSRKSRPLPDLFIFALVGKFKGYFPGYSKLFVDSHNYLTWAILKAHTKNHAGYVRLKSIDPLQRPEINFKYFDEGNDGDEEDVESVVDGIEFVRGMVDRYPGIVAKEEQPGKEVQGRAGLRQFVKDEAWGHHASCTCKIGSDDDEMAVLDGKFRVRGVRGLRVVDASVFPKIPGFFIVTSIYMIAEKAADVLLKDAG